MSYVIEAVQYSFFYQMAALLLLTGMLGFIAVKLRQPLIVAFIAVGLFAGPDVLGLVDADNHLIKTLAELGIALLLFMVGLKLDVGLIRRLGLPALTTGLAQVLLTALLGGFLLNLLGYDSKTAALGGIALSFSSTIIVVKLLSDKRAIDSLYGKMALGILIVQDIVVILSMVAVAALSGPEATGGANAYLMVGVKVLILTVVTGFFIHYVANPLTRSLSRTPELMMIFAIGLAAFMAALCHHLDLSKELGGLLAGVALASTPHHNVIAARLVSLRDFLLLFFFVSLGAQMNISILGGQIGPALLLTVFVLLIKPLLIMGVMVASGYRKRTSFMTGISLAQISEFSLIFIAMTAGLGLVPEETIGLFTLTGLLTIGLSCYAITYNTVLHEMLERHLPLKDRKTVKYPEETENYPLVGKYDVIVFGLGRYGSAMARKFQENGQTVLGVDFDPMAVRAAGKANIHAIYGDAADPELPITLPLHKARVVVFAFHHYFTGPMTTDLRHTLAHILRDHGYKGHIAATSHNPDQNQALKSHGIDLVLNPFEDAARHGANHILEILGAEAKRQ